MSSTRLPTLWSVPALLFLAGCVGGGSTSPGPLGASVDEFDPDTGAVEGTITSDELGPLEGAIVGIPSLGAVTQSGPDGRYRLAGLPAGIHVLSAQALGYESAATKVEVTAGATTTANFQLSPLPSLEPFSATDIKKNSQRSIVFKLTPQCIHTSDPLITTCNGIRFACAPSGTCEVHYMKLLENNPEWRTHVAEVEWKPQSATTGKAFLFDVNAPNITRGTGGSLVQNDPKRFHAMTYKSPIEIRIDNPGSLVERKIPEADWCCDWFWRLFVGWCDLGSLVGNCDTTPDYGIAIDNPATVYFTTFFREPGPLGYTARPDA